MRLDRFDSADAFLRAAGPFLRAREAHHCLILGIAASLRLRPADSPEPPPYLATVRDGRRVVLVAFQTPPWQLVLSEVDEPDAMALIVADRLDSPFAGVGGPAEHVDAFARLWSEATGIPLRCTMRERIYRLTRVVPPRAAPGSLRIAGPDDAELMAAWLTAFGAEALGEAMVPDAATRVRSWLSPLDERTMYFWDDGGPVAMAGMSGPTPTGVRVGPVYTPPERRRRGYAGNLVAAASQRELDGGRRACFLFADLANPTSNHVYESIGFEAVRDFDQYRLA